MKRIRFRNRGLATAFVVVTALATAGGIAYATIPGPSNVYSACMLKGIGTMRLIDESLPPTNLMSRCTDKESELSWNQSGPSAHRGPRATRDRQDRTGSPATPEPGSIHSKIWPTFRVTGSTAYRGRRGRCCFPRRAAPTSICTTSAPASGERPSLARESSRCAYRTTCATPTPPSRCAPASRFSSCRGSWARVWQ
jgi:hypothetical protein